MVELRYDSILAVDGGGTRCRLVLCSGAAGRWSVEMGSANVSSDFEGAAAQIRAGLTALAAESGASEEALRDVPAYLGLAGITGPALAERLQKALPFKHVRIADDRPIALRGALGAQDGAVAHCGTGSFFALQAGGDMRFAGGWGLVLGDEASAAWLGRLALSRVLTIVDGLAPATDLSADILADFGGPAEIVAFAAGVKPVEFGRLAPKVSAAAEAGDDLGRSLMQAAADHIATTLALLGWQPGQALCLTGGIGPLYGAYLPETLQAAIGAPQASPLEGALALARQFSEELQA